MKVNIFYSWQSDLPNNKNRGFIQDCIEKAIKLIHKEKIHLEPVIDRDIKDNSGAPDIVASIFSKIESTKIFIADVSIINSKSEERKIPNPNVLIELGYAAKTIGWECIILIFNTEFGKVEDLPFDLRFRKIITYQIEDTQNKKIDKNNLVEMLKKQINLMIDIENNRDRMRKYIKKQIDEQIFGACSQLFKILYGYKQKPIFENIIEMIKLSKEEINRLLFKKEILGFIALKDWKGFIQKLKTEMNQQIFIQYTEPYFKNSLLSTVTSLENISAIFEKDNLFIDSGVQTEQSYRLGKDSKRNLDNLENSYKLTDWTVETEYDYGVLREYNKGRVRKLLTINDNLFSDVVESIHEFLQSVNNWIFNTGSFIM